MGESCTNEQAIFASGYSSESEIGYCAIVALAEYNTIMYGMPQIVLHTWVPDYSN
jgi:pimeloyl-CoA synthetase